MTSGYEAHDAGEPISACPWPPSDPAGAEWRHDWITAEGHARHAAGTYGTSDDDYRAAGLKPPARDDDGSPIPTEPAMVWIRGHGSHRTLVPRMALWQIAPSPPPDDAVAKVLERLVEQAARTVDVAQATAVDMAEAMKWLDETTGEAWKAAAARRAAAKVVPIVARARAQRVRTCPVHGQAMGGGICRRCTR